MLSTIIQGTYRTGQKRFAKWLFYGLLLLTYVVFIVPTSGMPGAEFNDKVAHAGIFFVLLLMANITHAQLSLISLTIALAGYGLFTEISQGFLPYRNFSSLDWVADVVGLGCGLMVIHLLHYLYPEIVAHHNHTQ